MAKVLELHRGDTWTLDLSVQGVPPLGGDLPGPFDLSGCTAQIAIAPSPELSSRLFESFDIPPSSESRAGLARLVLPASLTHTVPAGPYKLHVRIVSPGPVPFAATQTYSALKVLPSLLPGAQ